MTTSNQTLIPILLRWDNQPLEKRYAIAFVTRDNYREDITRLAGDKGVQDLFGTLINFTFCTNCDRDHDPALDECDSPMKGVKTASFDDFSFSQNFGEYLNDVSEDEPISWMSLDEIKEDILYEEESENLGQTILLLWDNMTFAIAYYFPDHLDRLFETLDEYGDPSGQHFKALQTPFLIDLQSPTVFDDENDDFRTPTKEEEISEVGFCFIDPKIPDAILETLRDDMGWSEFSFDAQEAWYDSISVNAAKMSYNRLRPHLEEFANKMEEELSSVYGIEDTKGIDINCNPGFMERPIDSIHKDMRKIKELEAGCHLTASMDTIVMVSEEAKARTVEVVFYFYIGSVVKARVSMVAYTLEPIGRDKKCMEIDTKNSKILHDEVIEFRTIPALKTDPSTGMPDMNDIFADQPFDPSILDPVLASFQRACAIADR